MADEKMNEAIKECAKIIEEKCGKFPYVIVVANAKVKFATPEDRKKGIVKGTSNYMYYARPPLKKNGLSKLLLDTSRHALAEAEKKIMEEADRER
ncbi:MAG: hypothetical protein AB1324_06930 [Candidatus Micrarchaeota archaeon]